MSELLVVLVTFPNEESVRQIGTTLVKRQLIACINCLPAVKSIYQWEGKLCEESESLGIMKTTQSQFVNLEKAIHELHPYDVPEIIGLKASEVSQTYLKWIAGIDN